jgi:hypothetical protein
MMGELLPLKKRKTVSEHQIPTTEKDFEELPTFPAASRHFKHSNESTSSLYNYTASNK